MATPTIDKPEPTNRRRRAKPAATAPAGLTSSGTPQRRRRLSWALLGVLLVSCSVLGFALWSLNQAERTPVLVAATDIDAGQVIEREDVKAVSVGADPGVRLLTTSERALVVGQIARGPIPAGTPLSPLLVAEADAVPDGTSIVGASLSPGEYPTSALRAGDRVELVQVLTASTITNETLEVLGTAQIWTVEQFLTSGEPKLFISLAVDEDDAAEIANTISQQRLRLVLVGAGQ